MSPPTFSRHPGRRRFLQASSAALLGLTRPGFSLGAEPAAVLPISERLRGMDAAAPMSMQFRGSTPEEARAWQAEFGAKLRQMLGPFTPPRKWESVLERQTELADHVREERLLTADGLAPVPFFLLRPKSTGNQVAKRAGIVAIHGHGQAAWEVVAGLDETPEQQADLAKFKYDYGRKLVQRGYIVAVPCLTPFSRRLGVDRKSTRTDPCTETNLQLQYLGKLLISENLRDILWTLDYLTSEGGADPERIGCVGLSLGGRMTTMAAAVDPRIKVAVIAGALNCYQERVMHGSAAGCQLIPGLLEYGDIPEISALIAPRHCLWEIGSTDQHIPAEWIEPALERQRRVSKALGVENRLTTDRFDGGHVWHGEQAYPLLERVLRG